MGNEKMPLYLKIYKNIKNDFETGVYKKGDKIPIEKDLCDKYKVSRLTIRRALDELVREGLISRIKGNGSYFNGFKAEEVLNELISFTAEAKKMGSATKSVVLENSLVKVPYELKDIFGITENSKVVVLKRVRYIGDEPYVIETAYVNPKVDIRILNINDENMSEKSLYNILQNEYDLKFKYAEETIEVTKLSRDEAKWLNQGNQSVGVLRKQKTILSNNSCVEFVVALYRADKYKFKVIKNF